jgi:hypothetical protein
LSIETELGLLSKSPIVWDSGSAFGVCIFSVDAAIRTLCFAKITFASVLATRASYVFLILPFLYLSRGRHKNK